MDNKTKVVTGISTVGGLLVLYHIIHLAFAINDFEKERDLNGFKNAPVYFIQTDSTGKQDTMMMQDYLKKQAIIKAEQRDSVQVSDTTMMP